MLMCVTLDLCVCIYTWMPVCSMMYIYPVSFLTFSMCVIFPVFLQVLTTKGKDMYTTQVSTSAYLVMFTPPPCSFLCETLWMQETGLARNAAVKRISTFIVPSECASTPTRTHKIPSVKINTGNEVSGEDNCVRAREPKDQKEAAKWDGVVGRELPY